MRRMTMVVALGVWGCGGDDEAAQGGTTEGSTGGCIVGEEGCPCNAEGQCFGELVCLSDLCVENPDSLPTTGVDDGTTGPKPDAGGGESGGAAGCMINADCGPEEACADGDCYDTNALFFETRVEYFQPTTCADGFGDAELFFRAYQDDVLVLTSTQTGCPAEWSAEHVWVYDSLSTFRVDFWEADAFFDDHLLGLCWQNEGECTRVPKHFLHEGGYAGAVDGHTVSIIFAPSLYP